jgi:ribosomal protein S18 acetylase RimI-like enzyme
MILSRVFVSLPISILFFIHVYKASFVSLNVCKSNMPAIALYRDLLGFRVAKVEQKYCAWL